MIDNPTLIRTIQMIDVRRRWGFFCAGAGAPSVVAGMGSTATVGRGACAPADRLRGEAVAVVGLDARLLPDRFCGDAVAALWEALCVRAVAAPAVGADPASGTASG